ncbi:Pentatricopeptide repeat-containing protein At4g14850 [Linum perenne]
MYGRMQLVWANPDSFTFTCVLKACSGLPALEMGRRIQGQIFRHGFDSDVFVQNGLVTFYAKRGEIELANKVFGRLSDKTIVTWTSMISGYAQNGKSLEALRVYGQMRNTNLTPEWITFVSVLKAYIDIEGLEGGKLGRQVHALSVKIGLISDVFVGCGAFDMYSKTGSIADAGKLFDEMPERNIVTWNAYISNAVLDGRPKGALQAFIEFVRMGGEPDGITLCAFLNACADTLNLVLGKQLHGFVMRSGCVDADVYVGSALVDMYGKCGSIHDAEQTFREMPEKNLFAWNAMISGYAHQGHADMAIRLFREMASVLGIEPTDYVISSVVSACAELAGIELGRSVHALAVKSCVDADVYVGSALVDMYGNCGSIHDAEQTFREMPEKNLFAWNAMISGYAHQGHADMAIRLFREMASVVAPNYAFIEFVRMGGEPDGITLCAFLNACAELAGIELGRSVHALAVNSCVDADVYVGSALVDMYGKCGSIHDAEQTFREMPEKNLFAWNAMISGYAHQGHADMAIGLFREMASVVAPNYVTFVCVLSACSRGGAVETGMDVYESMMKKYGIEAGPEHYACVVDMLARSGLVERAYDFVQKLPIRPTISIWGALLNACRVHGKPEIGKIAADNLFELDPKDSGNHVLLSNMFAVAGR